MRASALHCLITGAALLIGGTVEAQVESGTSTTPSECSTSNRQTAEWAKANGYRYADPCPSSPLVASPSIHPASPSTTLSKPVEILALSDMSAWQFAGNSKLGGGLPEEKWVPKGQIGTNWSEMITITNIPHPGSLSPKQWIQLSISRMQSQCAKLEILAQTDSMQAVLAINGLSTDYPVSTMLVHCTDPQPGSAGEVLKKHEVILMKGMRGPQFGYLITRDWHSDVPSQNSVLRSDAIRQEWRNWAGKIHIVVNTTSPSVPHYDPPNSRPVGDRQDR